MCAVLTNNDFVNLMITPTKKKQELSAVLRDIWDFTSTSQMVLLIVVFISLWKYSLSKVSSVCPGTLNPIRRSQSLSTKCCLAWSLMKNAKAQKLIQRKRARPNLSQKEPIRSMDNDKLLTNILFYDCLFTKPKNSPNSKFFVSSVPYDIDDRTEWNRTIRATLTCFLFEHTIVRRELKWFSNEIQCFGKWNGRATRNKTTTAKQNVKRNVFLVTVWNAFHTSPQLLLLIGITK